MSVHAFLIERKIIKSNFERDRHTKNGDIVKLYPGEAPEVYDKAPSGRLYLDGNVSVEEDSQSIKDRKNLCIYGR